MSRTHSKPVHVNFNKNIVAWMDKKVKNSIKFRNRSELLREIVLLAMVRDSKNKDNKKYS